jgi:murein DD-endopeptidase MepM/ murein hydrolase activator NlpD
VKRAVPLLVVSFLVSTGLVYAVATLWQQGREHVSEIEMLHAQLALMSSPEPQEGGAETDRAPAQRRSDSEYVFPIAASDYVRLSSPYGYRTSPILNVERYHQGIDVVATWRAQVVAAADGVVVEHWPAPDGYYRGHPVYGGLLILEHENGWQTLYAHLAETRVQTGMRVQSGEMIGRVGNTGMSRGDHLHFEILDAAGQRLNPLLYVWPAAQ